MTKIEIKLDKWFLEKIKTTIRHELNQWLNNKLVKISSGNLKYCIPIAQFLFEDKADHDEDQDIVEMILLILCKDVDIKIENNKLKLIIHLLVQINLHDLFWTLWYIEMGDETLRRRSGTCKSFVAYEIIDDKDTRVQLEIYYNVKIQNGLNLVIEHDGFNYDVYINDIENLLRMIDDNLEKFEFEYPSIVYENSNRYILAEPVIEKMKLIFQEVKIGLLLLDQKIKRKIFGEDKKINNPRMN